MAYQKVMTRRRVEAHRRLQELVGLAEPVLAKKPRRKPPPTLEEIVLKHIRRMQKV